MALTLVGGGARSGKSTYALRRARECGGRLAYVATAQALDEEMRARVAAHQAERGGEFETIEEPVDLAAVITARAGEFDALVVDCLTLWLSNLLLAGGLDVRRETGRLLEAVTDVRSRVILVTNEVGLGIVPDNELARRFRDESGRLNQEVAARADEVWWMVFGCPMRVK